MLSIFQPLGVEVASGIAYGLVPKYSCGGQPDGTPLPACSKVAPGEACCTRATNMGWRYTLFTLGAICLFIFFLRFVVFRFQESPKFLLYRGKDEKAVKVMQHIARFNGRESSVTMEAFVALTDEDASIGSRTTGSPVLGGGTKQSKSSFADKVKLEFERYKILFANSTIARLTILVWITYIFDYWGFSIAGKSRVMEPPMVFLRINYHPGSFLPKILIKKGHSINVSVSGSYRDFCIIYLCGIPGVLLGVLMYAVPLVGRKWAMVGSSALMGVSLFLFATVNSRASNIGFNAMEYFFQSMFNAVLYGWTLEVFPAPIRGTACGLASFWGRLFGIVAPLVGAVLLAQNTNSPLYMGGAVVWICTIAILLMPTSRMGAQSY